MASCPLSAQPTLQMFRMFYLLWTLIVFVHEMGHLLGGLLVGDKFDYVRIGPFTVERSRKVRWAWNWGTIFSGATRTLPVSRAVIRWKLVFSTLAGPAANIASGWAAFLVVPHDNSMTAALGILFAIGSVFVASINLIPLQRRGSMNDGMRLWVLLFSKRRRERLVAIVSFVADIKQDNANNLLEANSLAQLSTVSDASDDHVFANYAAYKQQTDQEAAAQYLETCLANCSATTPDFRDELIVEAAKYQVLWRKRPDLAREWLALDKSGKQRLNRYFAEALILLEGKKLAGAISMVDEALRYIGTTPVCPLRSRQQQVFEKWRRELGNQLVGECEKRDPSDEQEQ
jgi:hypothetical protein